MPRKRESRIYARKKGGWLRYYADLRDYADVLRPGEPNRQALVPEGEKLATDDPDVAEKLVAARVEELERRRRSKHLLGIKRESTLAEYAAYHLEQKAASDSVTEAWMEQAEMHLRSATEILGAGRELDTIEVEDVQRWMAHLAQQPGRRPGRCPECGGRKLTLSSLAVSCAKCGHVWRVSPLSGGSRRKYLNSLSNLYRRAQGEGYVPPGYNPAASLMDKPRARQEEARWLEVHEAALLLEAGRLFTPDRPEVAMPYAYPLLATFLLTGGREKEVLGLEWDDVSFDRRTITFRPNRWRRLKTGTSHRVVPLWPQLQEILQDHLTSLSGPPGRLLFVRPRAGGGGAEGREHDQGRTEAAGRRGREMRMGERRDQDADVPAHLLRVPKPDAGSGRAGLPLHGGPRTGPRRAGPCASGLLTLGRGPAPVGGDGIPCGRVR